MKRFIKNLWFNVPQETWEFDSLGLKACTPAEKMDERRKNWDCDFEAKVPPDLFRRTS